MTAIFSTNDTPLEMTCANLQGVPFTVLNIEEQATPQDSYHYFQWKFTVRCQNTGNVYTFMMNPSKKRNTLVDEMRQALPVRNKTLVKKQFTEQRTFKNIVYYDLENYTPHSGTIAH